MNNRASPGEEWGFGGLVMTDWGAVHNRNDQLVTEAVRTGLLEEADLDRAVMRVLQLVFRYHRKTPEQPLNFEAHHELARKAASRSAVLLKLDNALDALQRRYTPICRSSPAIYYPAPRRPPSPPRNCSDEHRRPPRAAWSCCSSAYPPRTSQRDTTANTSCCLLTIWTCCMQCAGSPTR